MRGVSAGLGKVITTESRGWELDEREMWWRGVLLWFGHWETFIASKAMSD